MAVKPSLTHEITLTFSSSEIAQIEAFAALHGVSAAQWIHSAALSPTQTAPQSRETRADASWITETSSPSSRKLDVLKSDLFAPEATPPFQPETGAANLESPVSEGHTPASNPNRGTAGIASALAKGSGPVWEIRQALGRERVHGLGWTREQLAFVLKMSVVGVRKMEHLGKTPNKSLEARRNLLTLAQTLKAPTPTIAAFMAQETVQLAALK